MILMTFTVIRMAEFRIENMYKNIKTLNKD